VKTVAVNGDKDYEMRLSDLQDSSEMDLTVRSDLSKSEIGIKEELKEEESELMSIISD